MSAQMDTGTALLENLTAAHMISPDQSEKIKLAYLNTGTPIQQLLLDKKIVSEDAIAQAKAELSGIPFIKLDRASISPEVIQYVPEVVARRYNVFPLRLDKDRNLLSVSMQDPFNIQVIDFIEKKTGMSITPFFSTSTDINAAIDQYYTQGISSEIIAAVKESTLPEEEQSTKDIAQEMIRQAPISKIVTTLLEYAVQARASDVHAEPLEDRTRIRYRIDGILHERLILPLSVHSALVSRIKILSSMKIDERRIPQDGRFNFKTGDKEVDLRVSTLPTVNGEKVVMRLLKKSGGVPALTELGLRGSALKNLEANILRPYGIILVTGPTGSGKTTTLYSVLSKLNTSKVNIMTLEDPVEYQISGINQVQINPQAGLTFASGLRSFLRQDPNIILVGEIRDKETVQLAVQAALTGHLVFSTIHTNTAAGAIPRALDMGAESFLLSSSVNCIVGQRIVRRLCSTCAEEYNPPEEVSRDIKEALGSLLP
ncbi:MAG: GspE/PulE family protein, partial [bacterium]|nr:GspE/PulE family protein [bacterium]